MEVSFNRFNHFESSDIYLCNPNKQELGVVLCTATCTLRLNDISELTLEVQKYVKNSKGEQTVQPCYDLLQGKRLLLVDKLGYFEITRTVENDDDNGVYKTVSAESHQTTFKGKLGFTTEERVYKFYNSADPYDENYRSEDLGSVPSVVGQLYQQLGIRVDLQDQDNEATTDYDYWTITYIDDILRYGENKDDAIYRSFSDNQTNGYDFMVNVVENAFEMIWIFDFLHHTIQAKLVTSITTPTDIYLSFENLMQTLELTENAENIKTVLSCNGSDLDIRTINPMGTNYIVNFDYFKDPEGKWMSKELIEALNNWEELYKGKEAEFINLVTELRAKYEQQTKYQNIITDTQLRINELNNARDQYILNYPILAETILNGELSADIDSQFHTNQFDISQRFVCYRKSPIVENGKYVFSTVGRNNTLANNFDNNYLYFQDDDANTYCKLIKNANGVIGYERYGQYDIVSQWSSASEKTGLIIVGETVNVGENSLQADSIFAGEPFTKKNPTNFLCYKDIPKLVNGVFDFSGQTPLTSTFDECVKAGYFYFTDGSNENYCKLNQSAEVNVETNTATYYASGFTRYTTMENVTNWIDLQEQYNKSIENANNTLQVDIDNTIAQMQTISNECNIQNYIKKYDESGKIYNELNCYWIEGTYENENLAVFEDTTLEEIIDLALKLKEAGEYQMERVSQPSFSFSISTLDFTKLPQFQKFAHQLKLGRTISVEKSSGLIYIPAVTEITFNLDDAEEFTMTFSNSLKLNESEFTFMDLVAQSAKVSDGVISNWKDLLDYAKHKKDISTLIANPLDRSLRAAMTNMANQEFIVDTTGILGRKYEDDSRSSFLGEQMRIMNNTIIFTDDNWKTVKTALGKIYYDVNGKEESAYGLIAQTIVGQLLMSEELYITNENSSLVLGKEGITIKNNDNDEVVFTADINGNLSLTGNVNATSGSFKGHIEAISGYIGDERNGFTINSTSVSHNLSDSSTRILIGSGEDATAYSVTNRDVNHLMLLAGENFAVTQNGDLYANRGYISDLEMKEATYTSERGDYVKIDGQLKKYSDIDKYVRILTPVLDDGSGGTYQYYLDTSGNGEYVYVNGEYVLGEDLLTYDEYGNRAFTTSTARGLYSSYFKLETDAKSNNTIMSFWDKNSNRPDLLLTNSGIQAKGGLFDSLSCDSIDTEDIKAFSLQTYSNLTIKDSNITFQEDGSALHFGFSTEPNNFYAKLSWESSKRYLYLKLYDSAGNAATNIGTEPLRFKVHFAVIWGGDTIWNATVPVGKHSTSTDTKAFWGISYASFTAPSISKKTRTYWFKQGGTNGEPAIGINGHLVPYSHNIYALGDASRYWRALYVDSVHEQAPVITVSDITKKYDITDISNDYSKLFDLLRPVTFKYTEGTSGRTHIGLIANEFEDAVNQVGLDSNQIAAFCSWEENGQKVCGLRYEEFVALNINEIQKLKARIEELENKINNI